MVKQSKPKEITGRAMSDDEVKQLAVLRDSLKPETSWNRLDSFGKWIFTAVTTVGVLGAGFSNSAFQQLSLAGRVIFSSAILALGLALAFTVLGLTPKLMSVSTSSISSMRDVISSNIRNRQRLLAWAGSLFAAALVLAAFAPVMSSVPPRAAGPRAQLHLAYDLAADGKVTVEAKGFGLKPQAVVELALVSRPQAGSLPRVRGMAGDDGKAALKIELPKATNLKSKLFAASGWSASSETLQSVITENHQEIEIPLR